MWLELGQALCNKPQAKIGEEPGRQNLTMDTRDFLRTLTESKREGRKGQVLKDDNIVDFPWAGCVGCRKSRREA